MVWGLLGILKAHLEQSFTTETWVFYSTEYRVAPLGRDDTGNLPEAGQPFPAQSSLPL